MDKNDRNNHNNHNSFFCSSLSSDRHIWRNNIYSELCCCEIPFVLTLDYSWSEKRHAHWLHCISPGKWKKQTNKHKNNTYLCFEEGPLFPFIRVLPVWELLLAADCLVELLSADITKLRSTLPQVSLFHVSNEQIIFPWCTLNGTVLTIKMCATHLCFSTIALN